MVINREEEIMQIEVRKCAFCGAQLQPYAKFCPNCGSPVPEAHLTRRIQTGITGTPSLDELIEGGFEEGKTYLIAGETGTGKTIFSLQYLLHGIKLGEPGVYVTVDERPERLINDVLKFGWNLKTPIQEGTLSIPPLIEYFAQKVWGKEVSDIIGSIVDALTEECERVGAERLVIDPVAPLVATHTHELAWTREYIRSLIFEIENKLGTTTIVTSEVPTGEPTLSRFGVEEFLASGIIVLGLMRMGNRIIRTMYIRKMRWTKIQPAIYEVEIIRAKGIVIKRLLS